MGPFDQSTPKNDYHQISPHNITPVNNLASSDFTTACFLGLIILFIIKSKLWYYSTKVNCCDLYLQASSDKENSIHQYYSVQNPFRCISTRVSCQRLVIRFSLSILRSDRYMITQWSILAAVRSPETTITSFRQVWWHKNLSDGQLNLEIFYY